VGELLGDIDIRGAKLREVPLVVLGFGNVGQALARLLEEKDGFADQGVRLNLVAVIDRGGGVIGKDLPITEILSVKNGKGTVAQHPRYGESDSGLVATALERFSDSVFIDASPTNAETGEPGLSRVRYALEKGHSVVLASKGPLVADFEGLLKTAQSEGCRLGYSAAVGAPLPAVETVLLGLRGAHLRSFRGLFNETSNRILREMESGVSYEDALEGARRAGILETDPRLDLEGWDTAYKVLILARTFWNPEIGFDPKRVLGITGITEEEITGVAAKGNKIRLVGGAERDDSGNVEIRVEPVQLGPGDPLHPLGPGEKGAVFETDLIGRFIIRNGNAGPYATAAAIVRDVLNITAHPPVIGI
jgi:homoserine dehydrogenase